MRRSGGRVQGGRAAGGPTAAAAAAAEGEMSGRLHRPPRSLLLSSLALCSVLALCCLLGTASAAPTDCPAAVQKLNVNNAEEAQELADAVACSGGSFEVNWDSDVALLTSIVVGEGTRLLVRGSGTKSASIDGLSKRRIFEVGDAGSLLLVDILLHHGRAPKNSFGGAIHVGADAEVVCTGCEVRNSTADLGGAMAFKQGGRLEMLGNALIHSNSAGSGGAVYMDGGPEEGGSGCALEMYDSASFRANVATASGSKISSEAGAGGGAVQLGNLCSMSLWDSASVLDNRAEGGSASGGVWMGFSSTLTMSDRSLMSGNFADATGGAVYMKNKARLSLRDSASIQGNYCRGSGGAVFVEGESNVALEDKSLLMSNEGGNGGAMKIGIGSNLTMSDSSSCVENHARNIGGCFNVLDYSLFIMKDKSYVEDNTAAADGGGAFIEWGGVMSMRGSSRVSHNEAQSVNGGGIAGGVFIENEATLEMMDESSIHGNVAQDGAGGVMLLADASLTMANSSSISENTAVLNGGGVAALQTGLLKLSGKATVKNNVGFSGGGFALGKSSRIIMEDESTVHGNIASGLDGGGIFMMENGTLHLVGDGVSFEGNRATAAGGAIRLSFGSSVVLGAKFVNNRASWAGGLLIAADSSVLALEGTVFEDNHATREGGGILYDTTSAMDVERASFNGNRAACCSPLLESDTLSCMDFDSLVDCEVTYSFSECCSSLSFTDGQHCLECNDFDGVDCTAVQVGATAETLPLLKGYWRADAQSLNIRECVAEEACQGGLASKGFESDVCSEGNSGPFCAVCDSGYARTVGGSCVECAGDYYDIVIATIVLGLTFVGLVTFWLLRELLGFGEVEEAVQQTNSSGSSVLRSLRGFVSGLGKTMRTLPWSKLRIPIVDLQIITTFVSITGVQMPQVYANFLSWIQVLTFDMGWVLQASCILQTTFYDRLLFTTIAPLVVMSLLTGMYLYVRRKLRRGGLPPLELRRFQRAAEKHEVALLLIMFLLYSTISTMVFQTFSCNDLEEVNKSYLRADYSIECGTPTHHAYCAYAAIMVIVYPVGIPLAYFLLLWRQREVLQRPAEKRKDELSIKKTSFLWEPYKSERYYWEVAECGRRILLTGFLVFMFAGSSAQIAMACMLAFLTLVIFYFAMPYQDPMDGAVYVFGCVIVFFSMFLSLLVKVDVSTENSSSQHIFGVLLVVMNVLLMVASLSQIAIIFYSRRKASSAEEEKNGNRAHKRRAAGGDDTETLPSIGCFSHITAISTTVDENDWSAPNSPGSGHVAPTYTINHMSFANASEVPTE